MAGMRWSQTGNFGVWPNPMMPQVFGAQLYRTEHTLHHRAPFYKMVPKKTRIRDMIFT